MNALETDAVKLGLAHKLIPDELLAAVVTVAAVAMMPLGPDVAIEALR